MSNNEIIDFLFSTTLFIAICLTCIVGFSLIEKIVSLCMGPGSKDE